MINVDAKAGRLDGSTASEATIEKWCSCRFSVASDFVHDRCTVTTKFNVCAGNEIEQLF